MILGLEHSYAALPPRFHAGVAPGAVKAPSLLAFNSPLAAQLGLPPADTPAARAAWTAALSGNRPPADAHPLAMAYAGHQYAHFVPQLGDGRALLLGEKRTRDGLFDIQLKGSGPTPFSRSGDGRAAVGPMLREYLVSEAMHALGIPTTRSLAVVATGEQVFREEVQPGAVLTRVAASHLRVGTFEFFAAREDHEGVRLLLDYAIRRHDPDLAGRDDAPLAFLQRVADRQAALIAQWMGVGFIHGVMNTDNMTISGETIDYGPCAFMDHYDPQTVFSSIDRRGRYAYGNQPAIAQWNLARLAETLLPLIDADNGRAIERATAVVQGFLATFDARFRELMNRKLGFATTQNDEEDAALLKAWLPLMQHGHADFTNAFRTLGEAALGSAHEAMLRAQFDDPAAVEEWLSRWRTRLAVEGRPADEVRAAMHRVNPALIPRNHRVEAALRAASDGNLAPFEALLALVQSPFEDHPGAQAFLLPPRDDERVAATFCGT